MIQLGRCLREFALFIGLVLVWRSTWLAVKIGLDTAMLKYHR